MGFVTNRWQPVNTGPGPTPLPAWEKIRDKVTATTTFNYSEYDYTEYLILVNFYEPNAPNDRIWAEFFYIPEHDTIMYAGYLSTFVRVIPNPTGHNISFYAQYVDSNYTDIARVTIYGRKKSSWSLVSDNSALPNYTELATCNGYYTPFNYQVADYRASGGYNSLGDSSIINFRDYRECVYNNAYTHNYGGDAVYTRMLSREPTWTHINSITDSVSIADISFSEMFVVGRRMGINGYDNFQAVYLIPDMLTTGYVICAGGRTKYNGSSTGIRGGWGRLTITDTSLSGFYRTRSTNTTTNTFQSLDIYYR